MLGKRFLDLLIELTEDQEKQENEVNKKGNSDMRLGAAYIRDNRIGRVMSQLKEGIASDQKKIIIARSGASENFDNVYNAIPTNATHISAHKGHITTCFHECDSLTQPTQTLIKEYCLWMENRSLSSDCLHGGLKELDAFYQEHSVNNWENYILRQNKFV